MVDTPELEPEIPSDLEGMAPEDAAVIARERAVKAEAELGEAFIEANRGWLWEETEARPYLRLRMALACLLERAGKLKEARSHFEALLRFTPTDPQKVRCHLAHCLARMGDLKALRSLLADFADDPSPFWVWMTLLCQVRTGQEKTARATLLRARAANPHLEGLLKGLTRPSRVALADYAPESLEAATRALHLLGPAWAADREAMYWLMKA